MNRLRDETLRPGRPEAARVVWTWRADARPGDDDVSRLRRSGSWRGMLAIAVGIVFAFVAHLVIAGIVLVLGTFTLLAALLAPRRVYGPVHRFGLRFGGWVGRALGFVLMPLLFFLIVTPLALVFRLQRRDAMQRARDAEAVTYWTVRDEPERDETHYRRQF